MLAASGPKEPVEAYWANDLSTLELDLCRSRRGKSELATAVVRECRPANATSARPKAASENHELALPIHKRRPLSRFHRPKATG